MSTRAVQTSEATSWKQEVNQRVAAHRSRREQEQQGQTGAAAVHFPANSRAAQAAARVAARYAQAPSYSQMLADEARSALRAAEAASKAALQAQAAAQSVLAELETARLDEMAAISALSRERAAQIYEPEEQPSFFDPFFRAGRQTLAVGDAPAASELEIRWEPDLPVRSLDPYGSAARARAGSNAESSEDWRGSTAVYGDPETVEPAQAIPANLIEFPREIIAPRKARPRIAEGPMANETGAKGQLSIFEVDPGTISIQPEPAIGAAVTTDSGWSSMRLDAEPERETGRATAAVRERPMEVAPFTLRLMAGAVDLGLIGAVFVAGVAIASENLTFQPSMKIMEFAGAAAFFGLSMLYQLFFFTLAKATPGMRYAGISLRTFAQESLRERNFRAASAQCCSRCCRSASDCFGRSSTKTT